MKIAIRGEGSTDIGSLEADGSLKKGPMLILLEKLDCYRELLNKLGNSEGLNKSDFIEWNFIHKDEIKASSGKRRVQVTRGKKGNIETKGFYKNSEAFAHLAKENNADIAIFFVDTDKESNELRYNAVKSGLQEHSFDETGVPMIPTKISEAWLMCCLDTYINCEKHEKATSDKTSLKHPKKVCDNSGYTRHEIAENCDPNKIDMPSFNHFRDDFSVAVNSYMKHKVCE